MKKIFCLALLITFFAGNFFAENACAEIKTYTGVGEYIISMKETPEFGYKNAQLYAEKNAQEQAGVFIANNVQIVNSQLQKDEIITFTAGILKNISVQKRETIPLLWQANLKDI